MPKHWLEHGKSLKTSFQFLLKQNHDDIAAQWRMAINFMLENDTFEQERKNFQSTIHAVDKIRDENLVKPFPELAEML